ncbi:unnamed protein product, partial [Meganyctiphanes norvegica]
QVLPPTEVFLSVPYAAPPVGAARFSPTNSPLPWDGVRTCVAAPPACPQPSIWPPRQGASAPNARRAAFLAAVSPLLANQSEDCLYLNIYAPQNDESSSMAVIVWVHGESFSWGAGSIYDASVLASYARVVVVTLNYRLGPLGFLNTSPGGRDDDNGIHGVVGNQGLLDILAALSWVRENIQGFHGNPHSVTLLGHTTGAALVNYLLVSPVVVPDMFHRAILMSGSAHSPWAEVRDALSVTARLAHQLNCPLPNDLNTRHPETMACLRNVSASELVKIELPEYKFNSVWGPSIDGVVVQQDFNTRPVSVSGQEPVSVLFGVTDADATVHLSQLHDTRGVNVQERDQIFRTYVRNNYHHHLQEIFLAIIKDYSDWGNPSHHPIKVRDLVVEALCDAEYVAPMAKFGQLLAERNNKA